MAPHMLPSSSLSPPFDATARMSVPASAAAGLAALPSTSSSPPPSRSGSGSGSVVDGETVATVTTQTKGFDGPSLEPASAASAPFAPAPVPRRRAAPTGAGGVPPPTLDELAGIEWDDDGAGRRESLDEEKSSSKRKKKGMRKNLSLDLLTSIMRDEDHPRRATAEELGAILGQLQPTRRGPGGGAGGGNEEDPQPQPQARSDKDLAPAKIKLKLSRGAKAKTKADRSQRLHKSADAMMMTMGDLDGVQWPDDNNDDNAQGERGEEARVQNRKSESTLEELAMMDEEAVMMCFGQQQQQRQQPEKTQQGWMARRRRSHHSDAPDLFNNSDTVLAAPAQPLLDVSQRSGPRNRKSTKEREAGKQSSRHKERKDGEGSGAKNKDKGHIKARAQRSRSKSKDVTVDAALDMCPPSPSVHERAGTPARQKSQHRSRGHSFKSNDKLLVDAMKDLRDNEALMAVMGDLPLTSKKVETSKPARNKKASKERKSSRARTKPQPDPPSTSTLTSNQVQGDDKQDPRRRSPHPVRGFHDPSLAKKASKEGGGASAQQSQQPQPKQPGDKKKRPSASRGDDAAAEQALDAIDVRKLETADQLQGLIKTMRSEFQKLRSAKVDAEARTHQLETELASVKRDRDAEISRLNEEAERWRTVARRERTQLEGLQNVTEGLEREAHETKVQWIRARGGRREAEERCAVLEEENRRLRGLLDGGKGGGGGGGGGRVGAILNGGKAKWAAASANRKGDLAPEEDRRLSVASNHSAGTRLSVASNHSAGTRLSVASNHSAGTLLSAATAPAAGGIKGRHGTPPRSMPPFESILDAMMDQPPSSSARNASSSRKSSRYAPVRQQQSSGPQAPASWHGGKGILKGARKMHGLAPPPVFGPGGGGAGGGPSRSPTGNGGGRPRKSCLRKASQASSVSSVTTMDSMKARIEEGLEDEGGEARNSLSSKPSFHSLDGMMVLMESLMEGDVDGGGGNDHSNRTG